MLYVDCIANRPEDRFATADEVLQNFEQAYKISDDLTSSASSRLISADLFHPLNCLPGTSAMLSSRPSNALLDENIDVDDHELVSLQHSGYIPVPIPAQSQSGFKREDYNAPTTRFDPVKQQGQLTCRYTVKTR